MKNIKVKVIFGFCITFFAIIAIVISTVSWRLSANLSNQSKMLEETMLSQAKTIGIGHHKILQSILKNIKKKLSNILKK